eukprot:6471018-Amphidinium_carterae.1
MGATTHTLLGASFGSRLELPSSVSTWVQRHLELLSQIISFLEGACMTETSFGRLQEDRI